MILDATGKPAPIVPSEAKMAHDPEVLHRERIRFENLLKDGYAAWAKDISPDPQKPTIVTGDPDAVRTFHAEKFKEFARIHNAAGRPMKVDEDALYKLIDQALAEWKQQSELNAPLHQVTDLEPYGLLPVGQIAQGTLYINSAYAVSVSAEGLVCLWLRDLRDPLEYWAKDWLPTPYRAMVLETAYYTLQDLENLKSVLKIARAVPLSEHLMHSCRTAEPLARRNWLKRLFA